MKRLKKIVLLSHCILNQNSVVRPLARAAGAFEDLAISYISKGFGIYQLPCPELKYLGLTREPMTKEEYSTDAYKKLCKDLADDVILDLEKYIEDGATIEYLHGIRMSPTCSISSDRGIFMEYLIEGLDANNINYKICEVNEDEY